MLVAFRIVQAVGAALLTPTSLGLVVASVTAERRSRPCASGRPPARWRRRRGRSRAGCLLTLSWRWVFLVNVPIGILAFVGARPVRPALGSSRDGSVARRAGRAPAGFGIGSLSLGLVKGPDWGWFASRGLLVFAITIAAVALFVFRSARHHSPVVDPALLKFRSFTTANISALAFSVSFAGVLLEIILWMQNVWGYSPLRTGLAVAPGADHGADLRGGGPTTVLAIQRRQADRRRVRRLRGRIAIGAYLRRPDSALLHRGLPRLGRWRHRGRTGPADACCPARPSTCRPPGPQPAAR